MKMLSVQTNCHALLDKPRIYADLNGGGRIGDKHIIPLNSSATMDFWTDDGDDDGNLDPLLFQGVIQFEEDTQRWVAVAQWNEFHHAFEIDKPDVQEAVTANTDLFDTVVEYTEINLRPSARTSAASKKSIKL